MAHAAAANASDVIRYSRDIAPILANHCFTCHGPDDAQRKAGLRLDLFDAATATLSSDAKAIVPGDPHASALIDRINTEDASDLMPPPGKAAPLSPRQKALLQQWIAEGANYETHWSFVPPVQAALPSASNLAERIRNPIDNFVFDRLTREGLEPNPPADPAVLLRRVSLDLTGLPPTKEETEAFLADSAPDAYEKQVERLLQSPHFGERWAQVWMDLARYADTRGYEKDDRRTMWPFRDWVIRAINDNMPLDQFTREQIAGDLLENPTKDQIIATAFHRNTMTNDEGGTDNEEFRTAAVVDRVNTTMQVWMGMTMACAQCHTHKYDPITHKEYFEFYAFFNQSEDADLTSDAPLLDTPTGDQQKQLDDATAKLSEAQASLHALAGDPAPPPAVAPVAGGWHRLSAFAANTFDLAFDRDFGPEKGVDLSQRYAEGAHYWRAEPALNDTAAVPLDGENTAHYFYRTIEAAEPMAVEFGFGSDDAIKVWVNNELVWENRVTRGAQLDQDRVYAGLKPGTNTVLVKAVNGAAAGALYANLKTTAFPKKIADVIKMPVSERDDAASVLLASYREQRETLERRQKRLDTLNTEIARLPVMRELPADAQRTTHVFEKGSFLSPGEVVAAATPQVFQPFPADAPRNRLGLAAWLTARDNPLTARVIVNRYWEQFFGAGIVTTTEDFGTQGEWPTHPELLDWLAVELMEKKWDTKELCRLIVTSETYRQSSTLTPEKQERDPYNSLYARGPRFRLPAEAIRDQALRVSGLFSDKMYGLPTMPPQPEGLWQIEYSNDKWVESKGEDKYRRALYTFWRRTDPYPSMISFDAPSREVCTVSRIRTNTPIQALVTLNDPVFVEAAQALARRAVSEGGTSTRSRAAWAFETALSRSPEPEEVDVLVRLYRSVYDDYRERPEEAEIMATQPIGVLPENGSAPVLAAWTVVGNALLNTDEFLTKR